MRIQKLIGTFYATANGKYVANGDTALEAIKNCLKIIYEDVKN